MTFAQRNTDGTLWEPSTPDGYTRGQAYADAMAGTLKWYFRGGTFIRRGMWPFRVWRWARDGTTWTPTFPGDFLVLSRAEAIEAQQERATVRPS